MESLLLYVLRKPAYLEAERRYRICLVTIIKWTFQTSSPTECLQQRASRAVRPPVLSGWTNRPQEGVLQRAYVEAV